jgi:hypothetical protein
MHSGKFSKDLGVCRQSVQNMTKKLHLKAFKWSKVSRRDETRNLSTEGGGVVLL